MTRKKTQICWKCRTPFVTDNGNQKLCAKCREVSLVRRCITCGRELKGRGRLYCSPECYREHYRKKQKPAEKAKCPICGTWFTKKRPTSVYCSTKCKYHSNYKAMTRLRSGEIENSTEEKPEGGIIECNMCGRLFRSWDKTKNRRCRMCQKKVGDTYSGADTRLLEGAID